MTGALDEADFAKGRCKLHVGGGVRCALFRDHLGPCRWSDADARRWRMHDPDPSGVPAPW